MSTLETFDAVVVGGGPAGATAAGDLAKMGHKVLLLDRAGRIKPCGGAIPPRLIKDFQIPDELLVAKARSARMISPKNNQVDIPIDGGFVGMVDRDKFDEWLRVRAANDGATRRTGIFEKITRDTDGTAILHYHIHSSNRLEEDLKGAVRTKAIIGADGFGFRPDPEKGLVKIPQIGNVIIGNNVEIGANSSVDRGKFSSTILGDGCKIDNLVQIGHNSKLGMFCIMAGNSGLAGSVTLGNGVIIGGSASIKDHTTIGDGAMIGAGSGVAADVEAGKTVLGYPAIDAKDALRQWAILKRMVNDSKK